MTATTAQRVRRLRKRLKLSQPTFAAKVGVAEMTVSRWERGRARPSKLALARLRALELLDNYEHKVDSVATAAQR